VPVARCFNERRGSENLDMLWHREHRQDPAEILSMPRESLVELYDSPGVARHATSSSPMFRAILDQTPILLLLLAADGSVQYCNRRTGALLGIDAVELTGAPVTNFIVEDDRARFREQLRLLVAGNGSSERRFELRLLDRENSGVSLDCTCVNLLDQPDIRAVLLIARDLRELQALEQRLRDSERRFETVLATTSDRLRAVTQSVPDLLFLADLDLRIQFANRPMLGHTPEQLIGRSILDLLPEEERVPVRAVYDRALATREPQTYELRHVIDGEVRWFENRVGLVMHGDQPTGLTVASTEITSRRRGEEALKIQARILDAMREGVLVLDSSSIIRMANGAITRLSGYEPRQLIGRSGRMLTRYTENEYEEVTSEINQRLTEAEFFARDMHCMHRDGSFFTAGCVITPIHIGGEAHRLVVLEDVTQRRELEREIIDIANREQQRIGSDLHDGLGQELTGVALMLTSLVGRLKREHAGAAGDAEEIVALVNGAIDSARALARGVSPVSVERGGLPSALRALASRASDMFGATVRFRGKVWPQLTLDAAACDHFYRIAQEAVNNAVKHGRASHVSIDLQVAGANVTLTVRDNGRGMAGDAQLSRGMGLKIMHYRASMLSGSVTVETAEGGGLQVICRCRQPTAADINVVRN
jgi:PAS domain S-box-containing protein